MGKRGITATLFATLLAGGGAAVIGAASLPEASSYFTYLMYGGAGAIALSLIGLLILLLLPEKASLETRSTIDQRVTSHGQSGGTTAHTVIAPPERGLDANYKAQLLEKTPRGKPVELEAPINDAEAGQLAEQINEFLRGHGYDVYFSLAMGRPFPRGVEIEATPEKTHISVGRR